MTYRRWGNWGENAPESQLAVKLIFAEGSIVHNNLFKMILVFMDIQECHGLKRILRASVETYPLYRTFGSKEKCALGPKQRTSKQIFKKSQFLR